MINDNSIFSTNLNVDSKDINEKEFKQLVYEKLEIVLKNAFPENRAKQIIKVAPDRFQFACPFCRDSSKSNSKKRGNFIFKQGAFYNCYKCFNCGEYMSIKKFFQKFNIDLPLDAISYLSKHKPSQMVRTQVASEFRDSLFNSTAMSDYAIDPNYLIQNFGLEYITKTSKAGKYLEGRCITDFHNFLYDTQNDSLIIMNMIKEKVISFQMRPFKQKFGAPKYITISLRMIHNKILNDGIEIPDDFEQLSMVYNLYNINPSKPVLATEGPIDSMFLPNCIALLGAQKSVDLGMPLWYVYDSDSAGLKQSIEKLSKGCHVFMWTRIKNEFRLPNQKKWDINDFMIWCNKNKVNPPVFWSQYFTCDPLGGMMYI